MLVYRIQVMESERGWGQDYWHEDYDTYEGNMIRIFMKMANLLEEWRSLAMYCEHTEMLEKMRDFEKVVLRDVAVCSSLYISL